MGRMVNAGGEIEGITIISKETPIVHSESYKLLASKVHKNAHWLVGRVGKDKTVRYYDYQMNTDEDNPVGESSVPMREEAHKEDLAVYIVVKPRKANFELHDVEKNFWKAKKKILTSATKRPSKQPRRQLYSYFSSMTT